MNTHMKHSVVRIIRHFTIVTPSKSSTNIKQFNAKQSSKQIV